MLRTADAIRNNRNGLLLTALAAVLICLLFAITCIAMELLMRKGYMTGRVTLPFYALAVAAADELYQALCEKTRDKGTGASARMPHVAWAVVFLVCLVSYVTQFDVLATREWACDYGRRERVTEQFMENGGAVPPVEEPFDYTNVFYYEKISGEEFKR